MRKSLAVIIALIFVVSTNGQNVGIGTNTPDSSAVLELSSSNKGFLPPRITTAQRNAINHPAEGLQIFNTTTHCLEMYVYGRWQNVFCGVPDTTNNVDTILLTDIDGQTYPTVKICNQTWMAKNLDVARYRNGDTIPQVTDPSQWANLTTGAWCWYNNDSANGSIYGRLYNWYAVNDPRGLAPAGWHVASDGEFKKIIKCLDETADTTINNEWLYTNASEKLKTTNGWYNNSNGTNNSGFNGIGAGYRYDNGVYNDGLGGMASWWCNSEFNLNDAKGFNLYYNHPNKILNLNFPKIRGFSIRCIKDTPITTLNNGLIAYYPFNGNANDESGNGNNGTVNGATLTTDRFGNSGKAYSFDGVNDRIENSSSITNIVDISISVWAKQFSQSGGPFVHIGKDDGNTFCDGISLGVGNNDFLENGSNILGHYSCSGYFNSNSIISTDQWSHIVMNKIGNILSFYINGIHIRDIVSSNFTMPSNSIFFAATSSGYSKLFHGSLDDIRIYNRALTQEEISYLAGH
jgi:uncharacterized protein (TIGR02145 family)